MAKNKDLVERYLSIRGSNITEKTRQAFEWDLGVFLKFLGDKNIQDVTHIDIDAFIQYCREQRHNGDEALSRKYNTLNTFFKTMIAKEYLNMKNPLDKVEKIKVRKKVRGYLAFEEYKQIMQYLESQKDYRGLALFSLLFSSGIRISELYKLDINDMDFENYEFLVVGKGDKERICIFSVEAKERMLNYVNTRNDNESALFISRNNQRWSVSSIQQYIKTVGKKVGITKNIHPHLIRHGAAMFLLENDFPLDGIQEFLGHENISTTQIYARTNIKKVKEKIISLYNKKLTPN